MLRSVILALDDQPGRQMRDAHRGIGLVDVLTAGARCAKGVDTKLSRIDRDVGNRVGFRKHRHRARGSMNAPLRFRLWHPLDTMPARFELELGIGALPDDSRDDFLVSAHLAGTLRNQFELPLVAFGKARVHAKEIAREQR